MTMTYKELENEAARIEKLLDSGELSPDEYDALSMDLDNVYDDMEELKAN